MKKYLPISIVTGFSLLIFIALAIVSAINPESSYYPIIQISLNSIKIFFLKVFIVCFVIFIIVMIRDFVVEYKKHKKANNEKDNKD